MSRWSRVGWYLPATKKPPPERGIRIKKAGATWWGQRWIEALETVLGGDSNRLARGRTYARAGRVHDLVVKGGSAMAEVTGSAPRPYAIEIQLAQLGDAAWKKAIAGMVAKAQFSAELLAGQMPKEIDEVFRAAGVSLFPKQRADLVTSCSCPDWGDPCKHVAATHYVLGDALDRDPFLLFELRGKTKQAVLDALRDARAGAVEATAVGRKIRGATRKATEARAAHPEEVPTVTLGKLKPADYDRPREALPTLAFAFDAPITDAAVLRQLGAPAGWGGHASPADVLAPLVRAAAEAARRIAMAEVDDPPAPPRAPASKRKAAAKR